MNAERIKPILKDSSHKLKLPSLFVEDHLWQHISLTYRTLALFVQATRSYTGMTLSNLIISQYLE